MGEWDRSVSAGRRSAVRWNVVSSCLNRRILHAGTRSALKTLPLPVPRPVGIARSIARHTLSSGEAHRRNDEVEVSRCSASAITPLPASGSRFRLVSFLLSRSDYSSSFLCGGSGRLINGAWDTMSFLVSLIRSSLLCLKTFTLDLLWIHFSKFPIGAIFRATFACECGGERCLGWSRESAEGGGENQGDSWRLIYWFRSRSKVLDPCYLLSLSYFS